MNTDVQETPDQSAKKNRRDQFERHKTCKFINTPSLDTNTEVKPDNHCTGTPLTEQDPFQFSWYAPLHI
jgi:hypothetical protein